MTRFGRRLTNTGTPSSSVRPRSLRSARSGCALFKTALQSERCGNPEGQHSIGDTKAGSEFN